MIEHKSKKCKGTGQAKGHGCGNETIHRVYGLCKSKCYPNWLLTTDAGKIKMNKATLKATKPRRDFEKMEKEHKNRSGLTTLLESVKQVCHKYIRERDKGKPCISCGTQWHKDFHAGHFYKAELYSSLRFHELNINGQCVQCNIRLEGNLNPYSINLPERIGQWKFDTIKAEAEHYKHQSFKWDIEDLKAIRTQYRIKLKQLNQ
jgi:hypothetical protein